MIEPERPYPQDDYRWVLCSKELIAQMMEGWSPPVELMVTMMDSNTLEFSARTHTCEPTRSGTPEQTLR